MLNTDELAPWKVLLLPGGCDGLGTREKSKTDGELTLICFLFEGSGFGW